MSTDSSSYYTSQREALLDGFDLVFGSAHGALAALCTPEDAREILVEARPEFEVLIPALPYIGGRSNALTDNLVMAAWFLAFFRVMIRHGHSPTDTYFVLYKIVEKWLEQYPPAHAQLMGALRFSPLYLDSLKHRAAESQRREYPGDWVYVYVEGDGSNFDYGIDYVECGICKFFRDQGAADLLPFMCALDFPMTRAFGLDMRRTMTLGGGRPKCDFRLSRGKKAGEPDMTMQDIGVP